MNIAMIINKSNAKDVYLYSIYTSVVLLITGFSSVESICSQNCRFGRDYCKADGSDCLYGCYDGYLGQGCLQKCSILYCRSCHLTGEINTKETCSICKSGHFGDNCEKLCSRNCVNKKCDRHGNCLYGCTLGWIGDQCNAQNCTYAHCKKCSNNPYSSYCSVCDDGMFWNPFYGECRDCSSHCVGGALACNTTTGACSACEDKWYGSNCDQHCSIEHCSSCKDVYYGVKKHRECEYCESGWYLENKVCRPCSNFCSGGNSSCHRNNGHCLNGCIHGYFGNKCNMTCPFSNCLHCGLTPSGIDLVKYCSQCDDGYYWSFKSNTCKPCSVNCKSGCNTTNGHCFGGCKDGFYGRDCSTHCGHCANTTCDSTYGHCFGECEDNWYGLWCSSSCPVHCSSCEGFKNGVCDRCEAGWFGPICEQKCSSGCKRSDFNNFLYCEKNRGVCTYGCISGKSGPFCNVTCSDQCIAQICDFNSGKCSYGCNKNYYGEKCEKRCPVNCKSGCNQYNGRCDGCKLGFYGEQCEHKCSEHCLYGYCDTNGRCPDGCLDGFYGSDCTKKCSPHCLNKKCYQGSGSCFSGCSIGYYGNNCDVPCPSNCLHGCNRVSGFCIACVNGYFGDRCSETCASNCYNGSCDQTTARCTSGCTEGKMGVNCLDNCKDGYYGRDCLKVCGNCAEGTFCHHENGTCLYGCLRGWIGSTCKTKGLSLRLHKSDDSEKSTIAISSSATVGVLLTIAVLTIGALCYRRQRGLPMCTTISTKKSADATETRALNSQTSPCTFSALRDISQQLLVDPSDLQIKDTLGQGHFCVIKVASLHHKQTETAVMVKVLSKENQSRWRYEFFHEIKIMKSLNHNANILSLVGICENDSNLHSIFEFCGNGNMEMYLHNLRKSSTDSAAEIVTVCYTELLSFIVGVLNGLLFLEHNQIIHRHIAARNIYLDSNYTARLTNFNFALKCSPDELEAGFVKARKLPSALVWWMAPESIQSDTYSHQTDVWGVGMLLWEMVTLGCGERPRQIFNFKTRNPKNLLSDCENSSSPNHRNRPVDGPDISRRPFSPEHGNRPDNGPSNNSCSSPDHRNRPRGGPEIYSPTKDTSWRHSSPDNGNRPNNGPDYDSSQNSASPEHRNRPRGGPDINGIDKDTSWKPRGGPDINGIDKDTSWKPSAPDHGNRPNNSPDHDSIQRCLTPELRKRPSSGTDINVSRRCGPDGSPYKSYKDRPPSGESPVKHVRNEEFPINSLSKNEYDRRRIDWSNARKDNNTSNGGIRSPRHRPEIPSSTQQDQAHPESCGIIADDERHSVIVAKNGATYTTRLANEFRDPQHSHGDTDKTTTAPSDNCRHGSRLSSSERSPNSDRSSPVQRPSIPVGCDKVIGRYIHQCWCKDPKRRPTFVDLKDGLSKALKDRQERTEEYTLTVSSLV